MAKNALHEIHLTFPTMEKVVFERMCREAQAEADRDCFYINAKAITMYDNAMKPMYMDMLASLSDHTTQAGAEKLLSKMKRCFEKVGLFPIREKIECEPTPGVHDKMLGQDFHHYEYHITGDYHENLTLLLKHPLVCVSNVCAIDDDYDFEDDDGAMEDQPGYITMTMRTYSKKFDKFSKDTASLSTLFDNYSYGGSNGIEFSVYDSNPHHDDVWIAASREPTF